EHALLGREVLAVTWDGTGYGTDGTIWGGEILRAHLDEFERVASLLPFPLPGGEAAIREPRRVALGLVCMVRGGAVVQRDDGLLRRLGFSLREAAVLVSMICRGINTPWTSSV